MIDETNLLKGLVAAYPGFRDRLVKECDYWLHQDGTISPWSLFNVASGLCRSRFLDYDFEYSERLFDFVERCIESGSEDIVNAATTCFLENMTNSIEMAPMAVSLMGPLSRNACKEIDIAYGSDNCGFINPAQEAPAP